MFGVTRSVKEMTTFWSCGIDLNKRYMGYQLAVVNHYPQESVEFFELVFEENWSLVWKGCFYT